MRKDDTNIFEAGSDNIFADMGLEAAEELNAKSTLAQVIRERIRSKNLNQSQAAKLLGTDQGKVSQIMNGKIAHFTYDRLLRFLDLLGCDIEIKVVTRENHIPSSSHHASVAVYAN